MKVKIESGELWESTVQYSTVQYSEYSTAVQ